MANAFDNACAIAVKAPQLCIPSVSNSSCSRLICRSACCRACRSLSRSFSKDLQRCLRLSTSLSLHTHTLLCRLPTLQPTQQLKAVSTCDACVCASIAGCLASAIPCGYAVRLLQNHVHCHQNASATWDNQPCPLFDDKCMQLGYLSMKSVHAVCSRAW